MHRKLLGRRRIAAAACATVLCSAAHAALAQTPLFTLLDLGTLGGSKSEPFDINNNGQVVGFSKTDLGLNRAFRTAPNSAINSATDQLPLLAGGSQSFAYAINLAGDVAGDGTTPTGDRAYRYGAGEMINLGTLGGAWSYASGMNNAGQVTGGAGIVNRSGTHAFLHSGGQMYDLGSLAKYTDSYGRAINSSGHVVGYAGNSDWLDHAFLWTPTVPNGTTGTMVDLGTLGGSTSYAWSINDNNEIVGASNTLLDAAYHAFHYADGVTTDLGTLGGAYSEAFDINLPGTIVGSSGDASGAIRAFYYAGGTMHDLNTLVTNASGWTLTKARAINDLGQIVGVGVAPDGQTRGFVLTPVTPAPIDSAWNVDAAGAWSLATNWSNGLPNGGSDVASFGSAIQQPRTVTVDLPVQVSRINFQNASSYTLAGTSAITLSATAGHATIAVAAGSHAIAAPLRLAGIASIDVAPAGSTLAITNTITAATADAALVKQGAGTLAVPNLRIANLHVAGGTVAVATNGTASGASALQTLSIAPGATLDLADNLLVIRSGDIGHVEAGHYTGLTGLVASGYNGGAWNGAGITSREASAAQTLTTIGIATGAQARGLRSDQTALVAGQTITADSVFIMYTYIGDANLDGLISGDDYTAIDFNISNPGAFGYGNGDFNYDGLISGDDYTMLDYIVAAQGAPFRGSGISSGGDSATAAVPEPAAATLFALAAAAALARQRRRGPARIVEPDDRREPASAVALVS